MHAEQDRPKTCGGQCSHCSLGREVPGAPRGWRLVLPAMATFLLPLALAVAGVLAAGSDGARQTAGAFAGLLVGVAAAVLGGRMLSRRAKRQEHSPLPGKR